MSDYYHEERPWGTFKILYETPEMKVKELVVKPGGRLSYQLHYKRDEHWLIIRGVAIVTLNNQVRELVPGESVDVQAETKHRIENNGKEDVVIIEIQTGSYFGEDDIVRFSDDYNRV